MTYPAFRKEAAFKYENEYRFVIELIDSYSYEGFGYNIGKPNKLDFDIIINPLLKNDEFNILKDNIINEGFEQNIEPSILTRWLRPDLW